jgi:hypothetical protein
MFIPAWLDGQHYQRRRGTFHSGSMAVASQEGSSSRPHLRSSWLKCSASVQCGGAACWRGGRRGWWRRVVGEEEEVGEAGDVVVPDGSGSSLRAAPVFAANGSPMGGSSPPPSLLHPLLLRRIGVGVPGRSPGAARVGRAPGVSAAASYSCGQRGCTWMVGMRWGTRGAPRRRGHGQRAALWLWQSANGVKMEDDDDDVSVTSAWAPLGSARR